VRSLICTSNFAPNPLGITSIDVLVELYPIPELITITSVITPLFITGLKIAPVPAPLVLRVGIEKYSVPPDKTWTSEILPLIIIGFS